jgi:hypothetical protein
MFEKAGIYEQIKVAFFGETELVVVSIFTSLALFLASL